jgi:hypothetical protein
LRRFIAIALVVIFLFNFTGFYIYFVFRLAEIRREMRSLLKTRPESQLQVFSFTAAEFMRVKVGDDEIMVKGKMYDIARIVQRHSQLRVYAVHDKAEDHLLSFLDEVLKRAGRDKKPVPQNIFYSLVACLPVHGFSFTNHCSNIVHKTCCLVEVSDAFFGLTSPPPKA